MALFLRERVEHILLQYKQHFTQLSLYQCCGIGKYFMSMRT